MITVLEYCKILKDAEDDIAEFDRKIAYRKIELIGARGGKSVNPFLSCFNGSTAPMISDEEQRMIDNDLVLAKLLYEKQEYVNRIEYIKTRAELPEE